MNRELRVWLQLLFSAGLVCACAGCQGILLGFVGTGCVVLVGTDCEEVGNSGTGLCEGVRGVF